MDEFNDKELFRVRLRFLDLIKSFFIGEPDAEKMGRWRGTFTALTKEQVSPKFDSAVKELSGALHNRKLSELQEEYYHLFIDPFDGCKIETTASYYLDGKSYSKSLADIRSFMSEAGIKKNDNVKNPEDSLVVMLDAYSSLIEEEKTSKTVTAIENQAKLLEQFLEPFTEKFTSDLKGNEHADFYYLCTRILSGYLDLEKGLIGSV